MVKNPPAMQETPVPFLSREDPTPVFLGFPCGSAGKEFACNAGDLGSIPGLGRSSGEGIGYPLQYSWASLVAQLVKNLPAMRETWVQSLGWEDPLEKGIATHSSSSDGKESACNAGDPGLIPGSGRSPGEGNCNPLQYSCLKSPWTVA